MLSSSSSLKLGGSGQSEPLTRLACIRQCQETVQELVSKPTEICLWLNQLTRPITHHPNLQQHQAQNLAEKRARFESLLNEITSQLNSLKYLFVRLREIHEYVLTRESTATTTNSPELSRLLKQKSIYEEILNEKQNQLKIIIDTIRDITYQINTMIDLRHDGTINTLMNNANTQEK
ncbi:unnamed protein product [Rotaria sp. Silwood2]|nr:unnamed protein product [Rotaria sp. Silwood2]CAF2471144.1 unnamed protein product [Rotaria sp. Silwood2]CAF2707040.1 unnamed protein product [Rotaria sp. Silwood2]CAF2858110.1 unnamed protein product [Rotaria sp. Silwood2]CAF3859812.1 unnamed protein product [Rotaria sp. Silwood2]